MHFRSRRGRGSQPVLHQLFKWFPHLLCPMYPSPIVWRLKWGYRASHGLCPAGYVPFVTPIVWRMTCLKAHPIHSATDALLGATHILYAFLKMLTRPRRQRAGTDISMIGTERAGC